MFLGCLGLATDTLFPGAPLALLCCFTHFQTTRPLDRPEFVTHWLPGFRATEGLGRLSIDRRYVSSPRCPYTRSTIAVDLCPSSRATTSESSPRCLSQDANVRRRSFGDTRGTSARLHATARSRLTFGHDSTSRPRCGANSRNRRSKNSFSGIAWCPIIRSNEVSAITGSWSGEARPSCSRILREWSRRRSSSCSLRSPGG